MPGSRSLKMQDMIIQDVKMDRSIERGEHARHENDGRNSRTSLDVKIHDVKMMDQIARREIAVLKMLTL